MTFMVAPRKWTRDRLAKLVPESESVYDVIRRAGARPSAGLSTLVGARIREYGLDTSHFLGRRANCGAGHTGGAERLDWRAVLVFDRNSGRREARARLRRALIESGVPHQCALCGLGPTWNGQPLTLQIDHRNGDDLDNQPSNLRFACPNCHSQTPNFGAKNLGRPQARARGETLVDTPP